MENTFVISGLARKRAKLSGMVRASDKGKGVTYGQLVEKLSAIGVVEPEANIRNKLARGKFKAAFLAQCLNAIGSSALRLD